MRFCDDLNTVVTTVFGNASLFDKGDHRVRKTVESWYTAMTNEADNNSIPLNLDNILFF